MPKINVYLPDDLAAEVKALDLPVSAICQEALEDSVAAMKEAKVDRAKSILARFSDKARLIVARAEDQARELNHNFIGTEHLLLAMLSDEADFAFRGILMALEVSADEIKAQLDKLVKPGSTPVEMRPPFTPRAKTALELAFRETFGQFGSDQVRTEHIFLGLAKQEDGMAAKALQKAGIDYVRARTAVLGLQTGEVRGAVSRQVSKKLAAYLVTQKGRRGRSGKAGLAPLVEMHMTELKVAIASHLDDLARERDAERKRSYYLWDKLREHGIDPDATDESTT